MVRMAVAGAAGRMGKRIVQLAAAHPQLEVAAAFEVPGHPAVGRPLSEVASVAGLGLLLGDDPAAAISAAEVLVDFTAPEASLKNLALAAGAGRACVIGTTGLNEAQKKDLAVLSRKAPVVYAPNMSVGMNLMFRLAGQMAKVLGPDYALEVLEAHHDQKKDAPSGTAIRIIEQLAKARGWDPQKAAMHGRVGMVGARPQDEIGVSVIRGGDIVGDHTVYFIGQGERLELTHRAHSRDTFVQGALRAALWVKGRVPGLYDVADVLGLKE